MPAEDNGIDIAGWPSAAADEHPPLILTVSAVDKLCSKNNRFVS